MTRYKTKPTVIDAMLFEKNAAEVRDWVNGFIEQATGDPITTYFISKSMTAATGGQAWRYIAEGKNWSTDIVAAVYDELHETWVGVKAGQWIIRGTKGEFYPCDPDVFEQKYEAV